MLRGVAFAMAALAILRSVSVAAGPKPTFADRQDYAISACQGFSGPAVAVADTNGDGIPDLLCGGVQVLFGNGDGTFRAGPTSDVIYDSANPIAADLNGDGKVDLVLSANAFQNGPYGVAVSFGNGNGTFQPATFYQTGTDMYARWIKLGDFNGDGIPDIVTLGESGVWLFVGKGGGIFEAGVLTSFSAAQTSVGLSVGDMNGDGRLDLVAGAGSELESGFATLLGNGDGTFQKPIYTSGSIIKGASGFAIGDLNGDGIPDVAAIGGGYTDSQAATFFGNGDGTFSAPQIVPFSPSFTIQIADVNGDGIADLITGGVYVALGQGNGAFGTPYYLPISSADNGTYLLATDLRNNGRIDLIAVNFYPGLSVLLNQGKGVFQDGKWTRVSGGSAFCAASADFNGDGKPDLAVTTPEGVSILLGTGRVLAPLTQGEMLSVIDSGCPLVGDVNGDGIPDIVVVSGVSGAAGSVIVFLGTGGGAFTEAAPSALPVAGEIVLGDFNGDGRLDYASDTNLLGLGNGDGTFQTPSAYVPKILSSTMETGFTGIAAARLTGNRESDIVLTDGDHSLLYVLLSGGTKGFKETVTNTSAQCFFGDDPVLADVNGDGVIDLVLGCIDSSTPIYLNNGSGVFTYSTTLKYGLVDDGTIPLVADVNGDGIPDVVVASDYDLGIFLGKGSMTFAAPFYVGHGTSPGNVLAVDLHGQAPNSGMPDLVVPDGSGAVETIFNKTQ